MNMIPVLPILGATVRLCLRSGISNEPVLWNMIRGVHIYIKFIVLLIGLTKELDTIFPEYSWLSYLLTSYSFPLYHYLHLYKESYSSFSDEGFYFILSLNLTLFIIAAILRFLWRYSDEKAKGLFFYYELIVPDIFIFIVKDYADFSPVQSHIQGCAILVTLSFWTAIGVVAPMIISEDKYNYRDAPYTKSGLKEEYRMWHSIIKIEELFVVLLLYFNGVWLPQHLRAKSVLTAIVFYVIKKCQAMYWPFRHRFLNIFLESSFSVLTILAFWNHFPWLLVLLVYPFFKLEQQDVLKLD